MAVGLEMIGIEEKDTALRAMAGVAGGCWRGDLCGAIAGAAMVIGALFARADLEEDEDSRSIPTMAMVYDRLKELAVKKFGDTSCRTISRCNWYDPEDVKARRTDGRRDDCARFVGECARVLGEVLLEVVGEKELRILQGP
ncbi:MAG: C-GCAxxG-C-C family protein [Deltaproteobacteria bacterium]